MGKPKDELFRFLSKNATAPVKHETMDEELLDKLREFRDALGDANATTAVVKSIGTSKSEVSTVLLNDRARPLLLTAINISAAFRHSVMMSLRFLAPAKNAKRAAIGGRPAPTDVSGIFLA